MSKDTESRSRIHIKVGDIEIDVSGAQQEVDAEILKLREEEDWSAALAKVRSAREEAIAAAVDAAKRSGLPERGTAFKALLDNCNLTKRPDQVLNCLLLVLVTYT